MQLREFDTGLTYGRATAVLPDAPVALLGDQDRLAAVDLESGATRRFELADEWGLKAIAGLTGDRVLVVSIKNVFLYRLGAHELEPLRSWEIESAGAVIDVAAARSRFAVAAGDRCYVGDVDQPELAEITVRNSPDCLAVAVSPDGELVAAGRGGAVDVYTAGTLVRRRELYVNAADVPVLSIGLSPDAGRLVACDDNARTVLFDLDTGAATPVDTVGKAIAMRWSPDGRTCAAIALTRWVGLLGRDGAPVGHREPAEPGTFYLLGGGWSGSGPDPDLVVGTEHGRILVFS